MAIAARGYTCAIVRSNGTVFMWGDGYEFNGYNGKTNPLPPARPISGRLWSATIIASRCGKNAPWSAGDG